MSVKEISQPSSCIDGSSADVGAVSACTSKSSDNHRLLVLIADDHSDSLLYAEEAAAYLGYDVVTTVCGREVVSLAGRDQPDIILLDLLLDDVHGSEILQQLRGNTVTASIPVVAVTAMVTELDKMRESQAGFAGFLEKPYMIEDLAISLHTAYAAKERTNGLPANVSENVKSKNSSRKKVASCQSVVVPDYMTA